MLARPTLLVLCLVCLVGGAILATAFYVAVYVPVPAPFSGAKPRLAGDDRPNILFIVIDDLGFNDLGVYGGADVRTPNLDRLAAEGARFTRNYVNASCAASRVGMITGLNPSVVGFRPDGNGISPEILTLPESLRAAGYGTHHIGKWHTGSASHLAWPTEQGYDSFYGFLAQNKLLGRKGGRRYFKPLSDLSELYSGRGETLVSLLRRHALHAPSSARWRFVRPGYYNPWLQFDAEWPTRKDGHLSDIITSSAESFVRQRRAEDPPWLLSVWTFAPHAPLEPMAEFARRYPDTPTGKYLAMVEQVDASVGRILGALEESGLDDDTLVFVVSDNGGTAENTPSNLPFSGGKMTFLQGGIRTPLIMRWPGKISAGSVVDSPVSYLEYFQTFAAVAGAEVPAGVSGRNLVKVAAADKTPLQQNLYWESGNGIKNSWAAMTADGRWMLVQHFVGRPALFDLANDEAQQHNLIAEQPEQAARLRQDFMDWRLHARRVALDKVPLSDNGRAQLLGSSLQRAPGYGAYTFGIGLTPDVADPAQALAEEQFIAFQRNQWSMAVRDGRLVVATGDIELDAPAPDGGECASVVVTGFFNAGQINPGAKSSLLELYVDGELADRHESREFTDPADDYLRPTFIGQDDRGQRRFHGALGSPVILNERLVPPALNDGRVNNEVGEFAAGLCAGLSS